MQVCFNGKFYSANAPLFTSQNRGFRYGDGLFETMKVFNGRLLLEQLHFERLFISLKLLQIQFDESFNTQALLQLILELCEKNDCLYSARVRFAVYRDEDETASYLIEAFTLSEEINDWQSDGLSIAVYPYSRKSTDNFSAIKSANFLPYVMAGKYAVERGVDDALVLNSCNSIADSSKANIFLIKGDTIYTPALHQGCINGVMRRAVIETVKKMGFRLKQEEIRLEDLQAADEVFLTNSIQIIRWVKNYDEIEYTCDRTKEIFVQVRESIFLSIK